MKPECITGNIFCIYFIFLYIFAVDMMLLRTKRHTSHDIIRTVAVAVTALVLFSCQNDDFMDNINSNKVTIHPVISRAIETTVQTRALAGYSEDTIRQQALSVNAVAFDSLNARAIANDIQGLFAPVSTGWRSTVEVEPSYKYNLYTYSRVMPTATTPQFSYDSESNVSLTFTGLDIITENDPLVGVAVAGAVISNNNPAPSQYPDLTKGQFSIGKIPSSEVDGTSFKAFLALDHLYSKATLSFRVDNKYIYEVRIKDIQIKTDHNTLSGSHKYKFYSQNLELEKNNNSQYVVNGNAKGINLFDGPTATAQPEEGDNYIALTTSYREFGYYYFLPLPPVPSMYLEVTYDIYDNVGKILVRENQTARNGNLFSTISDNGNAAAGTNYKIKILVSPTYLYQLSDDLELGLTIEQ